MPSDPVCRQRRWLATVEDRADEFWRQEGEGQHLAEVLDCDTVSGRDGGEIIAVAQCLAPSCRPRDVCDQDVISGRLRLADDQTALDAAAALP